MNVYEYKARRSTRGSEQVALGGTRAVGSRREFPAVREAMLEEDVTPDFMVVDGAEGGTGAAPLEFADTVGLPSPRA
ncbi:glutamate synthase-related protein [Streptomyces sp. NPDC056169]|uniref:glutamate synthase-related protein n=1 Tax=Streptomyces sp. NPDC056169 TaxID=3345734 RepID=UPI0035E0013E